MCDKSEAEPARNSRKLIDGFCNKCKRQAPNASIRNAQFCRTCLAASIELKYRQNIFKSGIEKGLNVLVALSGSPSSRCVIDIVKKSHDPSARGNQFATVYVCNVQEYPLEFAEEESIVVVPLSEKDPNLRQMIIFNALLEKAKELNCKCVILGDNQTKIAIKTISYTAKGRGLITLN
jgi:predicted PP-loop superfamily ATPase